MNNSKKKRSQFKIVQLILQMSNQILIKVNNLNHKMNN